MSHIHNCPDGDQRAGNRQHCRTCLTVECGDRFCPGSIAGKPCKGPGAAPIGSRFHTPRARACKQRHETAKSQRREQSP